MPKKKKKSNIKKHFLIGFTVILVLGAFFGYHFYSYIYGVNVRLDQDEVTVTIPSDWTIAELADELKSTGVIRNKDSFLWVADKKNFSKRIKSGKYVIKNGMNNSELVNLLRSGNQTPIMVTFNNIRHLSQLAQKVSKQIEPDSSELMLAFLNELWMEENGLNAQTVQGIFIPNTYEMYWNTTAEQFVQRMFKEYQHFWNVDRKALAQNIGLTEMEVSTLASIVEAETKKKDEMPKVAGLYLNRLTIGMRLQSDPTVVFALNKPNVHRVYYADLKIESPYNTYIHTGLPPGPIGFPSTTALNAVLHRVSHDYIYMCAKPNYSGYHNFASSYSQHQRNASIYRAFLKREGIR